MDQLMIDKKNTSLVVIDLQKGIVTRQTAPHTIQSGAPFPSRFNNFTSCDERCKG